MLPFKKLLSLIFIFALIIGVAAFFYVRRRNQLAKLTAEAPAQVVSVSLDTDRTRSNNRTRTRYTTRVSYRYTVNGRPLTGQTNKSGDVQSSYQNDRPVKVCYEPAHPENSEIFTADYKCGS